MNALRAEERQLAHLITLYEDRLRLLGCHHPILDIVAQASGDSKQAAQLLHEKLKRLRGEHEIVGLQMAELNLRERWADMDPWEQEASFIPSELGDLAGLLMEAATRVKHDQHHSA